MWSIESAVVERPYRGKNHDRAFVDREKNIFAVFDGANNRCASKLAVAALSDITQSRRKFKAELALRKIHGQILDRFGGECLTTGSLVHLSFSRKGLVLDRASAGDSPIYTFEHGATRFTRETYDESQRKRGRTDASNFLGSPKHKLRQHGRRLLVGATTVAAMTDGITDPYEMGHVTDNQIGAILAENAPAEITAQRIMDEAAEFDDAAVIVVKACPTQ